MTIKLPANTNRVIGPNGYPDYKPMNPWGRPMPKTKRAMNKEPDPLYQVVVEQDDGSPLPVGPAIDQVTAQRCCEALAKAIMSAKKPTMHNPTVVRVA